MTFTCVLAHTHIHTHTRTHTHTCAHTHTLTHTHTHTKSLPSLSIKHTECYTHKSNTHKSPNKCKTPLFAAHPGSAYTSMPRMAAMVREILWGMSSALSENSSGEALSKVSIWVKVSDVWRPRSSSTLVKYSGKDITRFTAKQDSLSTEGP